MKRSRARKNFSGAERIKVPEGLNLSLAEMERGARAYEDWHWGVPHAQVVDWNEPDMPKVLIECGRLVRMHVRVPRRPGDKSRSRAGEQDAIIELSQEASAHSHIAYDPTQERLHLLVAPHAREMMRERFWEQNPTHPLPLVRVAAVTGGRHSKMTDYPDIAVKPLGLLTNVVYWTHKKGDGPSFYIHAMGEISHVYPILCCDASGRLWLAGGAYRSPTAGITD